MAKPTVTYRLKAHRRLYKHQTTFWLLFVHDLIYNRGIGDNMANNNNINNIITTNKNKLQIAGEQSVIHLDSVKETKADKISHCHQDLPKRLAMD